MLKNVNENLTVGDVLHKVLTMGSYNMKYNYRLEPQWSQLTEGLKMFAGSLDTKLTEVSIPVGDGKECFSLERAVSECKG